MDLFTHAHIVMCDTVTDSLTVFVENVEDFIIKEGNGDAKYVLEKLEKIHQHYQQRDSLIRDRLAKHHSKVMNNQESLEAINAIKDASLKETYFALSDQVFALGTFETEDKKVYLWLGANVMVEFSYDEAIIILSENIADAQKILDHLDTELDNIKSKLTTIEVNIARVHNFDVICRKTNKT